MYVVVTLRSACRQHFTTPRLRTFHQLTKEGIAPFPPPFRTSPQSSDRHRPPRISRAVSPEAHPTRSAPSRRSPANAFPPPRRPTAPTRRLDAAIPSARASAAPRTAWTSKISLRTTGSTCAPTATTVVPVTRPRDVLDLVPPARAEVDPVDSPGEILITSSSRVTVIPSAPSECMPCQHGMTNRSRQLTDSGEAEARVVDQARRTGVRQVRRVPNGPQPVTKTAISGDPVGDHGDRRRRSHDRLSDVLPPTAVVAAEPLPAHRFRRDCRGPPCCRYLHGERSAHRRPPVRRRSGAVGVTAGTVVRPRSRPSRRTPGWTPVRPPLPRHPLPAASPRARPRPDLLDNG